MGHLNLQLEPDGTGSGELFARFESQGFAGHGSAWFDLATLTETAKQFAQHPLPSDKPVCIAGGFLTVAIPPALDEEMLHISAHPVNGRGGIALRVQLACEVSAFDRGGVAKHCVSGEIQVGYEQLQQFSKALVSLIRGELDEVVLDDRNL